MNKIRVAVRNKDLASYVIVNDEIPKFVKDKELGCLVTVVECEDDKIDIKLEPFHHLLIPGWWILNFLLFFITLFAIFKRGSHFRKFVPQYHSVVHLKEGDNLVRIVEESDNQEKVIRLETDSEVEELINYKDYDKRIKRHRVSLVLSDILFSVAILAIIITIIVLD